MGMSRPVLVVIGPSASGKSTAVRELHRRGVVRVHPTWTTRPRRPDESDGALEHRFVTDADVRRARRSGLLPRNGRVAGSAVSIRTAAVTLRDDGPIDASWPARRSSSCSRRTSPTGSCTRSTTRATARGSDSSSAGATRTRSTRDSTATRPRSKPAAQIASRCFVNDGTLDDLVAAIATALARRRAARSPRIPRGETRMKPHHRSRNLAPYAIGAIGLLSGRGIHRASSPRDRWRFAIVIRHWHRRARIHGTRSRRSRTPRRALVVGRNRAGRGRRGRRTGDPGAWSSLLFVVLSSGNFKLGNK